MPTKNLVLRFDKLSCKDAALLGAKDAALGGLIRTLKGEGVRVPEGFAATATRICERNFIGRRNARNSRTALKL